VQELQRVAFSGMAAQQYGHSRVLGGAGAGCRFIRFTCRTSRKITNATIMKFSTLLMKMP
jgi:hypothetical protein